MAFESLTDKLQNVFKKLAMEPEMTIIPSSPPLALIRGGGGRRRGRGRG